jgi:hypothetical protein
MVEHVGFQGEPPQEHKEQEQPPYYQAARYIGQAAEARAGHAYAATQDLLFNDKENDLSAFRLQIRQMWHVAVVGNPPAEELEQQIEEMLSGGEPATLSPDVLKLLQERRQQATKVGSWVEAHYRPGKPLDK